MSIAYNREGISKVQSVTSQGIDFIMGYYWDTDWDIQYFDKMMKQEIFDQIMYLLEGS